MENSNALTFGAWFQQQRELSGKKQQQVADEVGINKVTISKIENGGGVSADLIIKLCRSVNIDEEEGILRAFLPSRAEPDAVIEREIRRLAKVVPTAKRDVFIRTARSLAEAMAV